MHDRPNSILAVPSLTADEIAARIVIDWCTAQLRIVVLALRGVAAGLPEPPEDQSEAMGTGKAPESVAYSLAGTVDCIVNDDLLPAIHSLFEAAQLTPAILIRDWQRSQGERP